ncbi:MAG: hypothetical protein KDA86_01440 [Planctomycetaceae bacterium]|nr:hypothetical protein [Planctomycetaceae bacterium]MCA9108358.1 hypothetical protein [Planctomycetaceae bacterium]
MKQFMMLCVCIAIAASSVGCCWWQPYGGCGGGCGGGACGGAPSYYGGYPAGAYYGGTSTTAAMPMTTPYAYSPGYPVTAGLPINSLPTY